jgi:hypothetical protein
MRLLAVALTLSLAGFAAASAQTATPDSENGRYSFNPVADGVLRLDTRTGQVSQCSRSDAGWACKVVPDERSALETEIARLQGENATMKKELLSRGLPVPGVSAPSGRRAGDQAAERCRHRQGGFVRRESLAPFDRHGQEGAARRREEKLSELERARPSAVPASPR